MLLYNGDINLVSYESANLFVILAGAMAMHAQVHYFEELYFDYYPLTGKQKIHNRPFHDYDNDLIDDKTGIHKNEAL